MVSKDNKDEPSGLKETANDHEWSSTSTVEAEDTVNAEPAEIKDVANYKPASTPVIDTGL